MQVGHCEVSRYFGIHILHYISCNTYLAIHIFKYISWNLKWEAWAQLAILSKQWMHFQSIPNLLFDLFHWWAADQKHWVSIISLRLRLKVGHTNWSKETSFAIWASELLVFPILLFTDRKLYYTVKYQPLERIDSVCIKVSSCCCWINDLKPGE